MKAILNDFKGFLLKGNIVDLAVAVVIGIAFGAVVSALVADIITPLVAAVIGKSDFGALHFTINNSVFAYGDLINKIITFVSTSAAIFFLVVKPMQKIIDLRSKSGEPTSPSTRECPQCISIVPIQATKCAYCTSDLPAVARNS